MHAHLRRLEFLIAILLGAVSLSAGFQQDLVLGTWVLNVEKSSYDPGPSPRSQTRTYETVPEGIRATIVTVDAKGQSMTARYTADYDSLEHPLTGSTTVDAIALKKIDARTAEATLTHARKVIGTARRVISPDGKTMTITFRGSGEDGRQVVNVAVYEKGEGR
jgi:hypothetical protein